MLDVVEVDNVVIVVGRTRGKEASAKKIGIILISSFCKESKLSFPSAANLAANLGSIFQSPFQPPRLILYLSFGFSHRLVHGELNGDG